MGLYKNKVKFLQHIYDSVIKGKLLNNLYIIMILKIFIIKIKN